MRWVRFSCQRYLVGVCNLAWVCNTAATTCRGEEAATDAKFSRINFRSYGRTPDKAHAIGPPADLPAGHRTVSLVGVYVWIFLQDCPSRLHVVACPWRTACVLRQSPPRSDDVSKLSTGGADAGRSPQLHQEIPSISLGRATRRFEAPSTAQRGVENIRSSFDLRSRGDHRRPVRGA